MGKLSDHARTPAGRPASRVQAVLDELGEEDRADLLGLLVDPKVSAFTIEAALRSELGITLSRQTVKIWRENNYPEVFSGRT